MSEWINEIIFTFGFAGGGGGLFVFSTVSTTYYK